MMASKTEEAVTRNSRTLGMVWFLVCAGLAYPVFQLLESWGFHPALAGVTVFVGACLLYEIPYRARVRAQNELAARQTNRWRH